MKLAEYFGGFERGPSARIPRAYAGLNLECMPLCVGGSLSLEIRFANSQEEKRLFAPPRSPNTRKAALTKNLIDPDEDCD